MKASDVQELQFKLQKLQFELRQNRDSETSEEVTEENGGYGRMVHGDGDSHGRDLRIDDFEISTTLGNIEK